MKKVLSCILVMLLLTSLMCPAFAEMITAETDAEITDEIIITDGDIPEEITQMSKIGEVRAESSGRQPRVAVGTSHTVYLASDGKILTWGKYYNGEKYIPVNPSGEIMLVEDLESIVDVASGGGSALALTSDGTVWAWGDNTHGQLGNNTTTDSATPVQVQTAEGNLTNVIAIAMGETSAAAITIDGAVYAWGDNTYGQLGSSSLAQSSVAVRVSGINGEGYLSGVKKLSIGSTYVLALKTDGTVCSWGDNTYGQLGDGTSENKAYPVCVTIDGEPLSGIKDVSAGAKHSLARTSKGKVYAWGRNEKGQLGNDTELLSEIPMLVSGVDGDGVLEYITDISAGYEFSVARRSDGKVLVWGANEKSQLGDGRMFNRFLPTEALDISSVVRVYAGKDFLTVEKANGELFSVGANEKAQLGDAYPSIKSRTWLCVYTPVAMIVEACSTSDNTTLMLATDGTLWGAGKNTSGELGNGLTERAIRPVAVKNSDGTGKLRDVICAKRDSATFAIKSDGTVWFWGTSIETNGETESVILPMQVKDENGAFVTNAVSFSETEADSIVKGDGSIWTWDAENGRMYDAQSYEEEETPEDALKVDGDLMLKKDGTVWTRGSNRSGMLGIGENDESYTTTEWVQVKGLNGAGYLENIVQISSGMSNLALGMNGRVYAWGDNSNGTCGDNTTTNRHYPRTVDGLRSSGYLNNVIWIKANGSHNFAFLEDGRIVGWGHSMDGEFGAGSSSSLYKYPNEVFSGGELYFDDYGDSFDTATEITENRRIVGRRTKNTDLDYFTFVHHGGESVTRSGAFLNENKTSLTGSVGTYNPETGSFTSAPRDGSAYLLEEGERYYFYVTSAIYNAQYSFRFNSEADEREDESLDDYGDNISDAYEIPTVDNAPKHTTYGGIDCIGDIDVFKFEQCENDSCRIYTTGNKAVTITLSDSAGEEIEAGTTETIETFLEEGEEYYVTVSSAPDTLSVGGYKLHIEREGFDIYAYDEELLGYKHRITNFCKELFNDGNQHMSQTVYNEYELAFDADLAVHELPESIESISDGLTYEAAVREYFFTKQEELEEVKQGYLDIIEEYIEVEPLSMNAEVEHLSPNAVMNADAMEEENETSTIIRRPSGGAGAPLSVVQSTSLMTTDEIIENETVAEMTATTVASGTRPLLRVVSKENDSITIQAKFPTPGAVGNEIWVIDLNNGVTKEKLVFSGNQTTDESKTVTSNMLDDDIVPGGMYVIGMYWSTDGGVTNGGENARFVWVQLPPNTDTDLSLSTSSNQKVKVRVEAGDKAESSVNSIDYFTPWINNMGSVYETLQDFTGYTPSHGSALEFRSTRASMNGNNLQSQDEIDNEENYWFLVAGYASNPAMISRPFFRSFMMRLKDGDWGDAVIHEMSHAFDHDNWSFDMEVWADLKLCYVLEQHPGSKIYRFDTKEYYDKDTIYDFFKSEQYYSYDNTFAKGEYHHRGMTAVMLDIAELTGWGAFRTVLRDMNELNEDEYKYIYEENLPEPMAKFNLFISKLNTLTDVDIITAVLNKPVAEGETKTVAEVITDCYGGYIEYYNLLRTLPSLVNKETVNMPSAGYVVRRFIPDETGMYYFFTTRYGGTGVTNDTVIEIFEDDYLTILKKRSNSSTGTRFSMVGAQLNANQTYYIKVRAENDECILHADIDVHKGEIEQLTGAESVDKPAGQAGIFEFKPTLGGDYIISTSVHDDGEPVITDAIIEVFENDLSNRIERSTYEQAKFPGITVAGLTSDKTYYIVLKGYVGRQVKAELSIRRPSYAATVEYHFDEGYEKKYGSDANAKAEIMKYHNAAVEKFEELCNLIITLHNDMQPMLYESSVKKCDLATHTIDGNCSCSSADSYLAGASNFGGSNLKTVGVWSGYTINCWGEDNRSFADLERNIIVLLQQNKGEVADYILGVLIHEMGHQYGAPDHYHEGESIKCEHFPICSVCGSKGNKRNSKCIMSSASNYVDCDEKTGNQLFCSDCKADIIEHLNDHHWKENL